MVQGCAATVKKLRSCVYVRHPTWRSRTHACLLVADASAQHGILKPAKRPGNASFISSIDERLATSHALLYDIDRKVRTCVRARASMHAAVLLRMCAAYMHHERTQIQVKDMVPALGKLLVRNDDIAALEQVRSYQCSRVAACARACKRQLEPG